ncbi:CHAD domain-containing protein [Xanthobacteraceae bacterium A53D]
MPPHSASEATFASRVAAEAALALTATLNGALDKVTEALADDDDTTMVHEVRKALKEYRALLRLVPGEEATVARKSASAIARTLSAARDRQAARDALDALAHAGLLPAADAERAKEVISRLPEPSETPADPRAQVQSYLDEARAALAGEVGAAARAADVVASLTKAYRRSRNDADWSHAEGLHDLRKHVVVHRYQMAFLADFSGTGGGRARKAQRLRDILGIYQDLEALKPLLADALGTSDEQLMSEVAAASRALQRRLLKEGRSRHMKLFQRKPKEFSTWLTDRIAKVQDAEAAPAA